MIQSSFVTTIRHDSPPSVAGETTTDEDSGAWPGLNHNGTKVAVNHTDVALIERDARTVDAVRPGYAGVGMLRG